MEQELGIGHGEWEQKQIMRTTCQCMIGTGNKLWKSGTNDETKKGNWGMAGWGSRNWEQRMGTTNGKLEVGSD